MELDNGVSLDFDAVFGRIRERGLEYWADPRRCRPGEINHNDGGRGVYFAGPDGHYLEVITRPYGSGGSWASGKAGGPRLWCRRSAELLGESDEKAFRAADVAEPIRVLITHYFA